MLRRGFLWGLFAPASEAPRCPVCGTYKQGGHLVDPEMLMVVANPTSPGWPVALVNTRVQVCQREGCGVMWVVGV
jgi:hypothetical protein